MWFLAFIGVYLAALLTPVWFFAMCALLYALFRKGYELILIGVLIDAQFGLTSASFAYLYTLITSVLVLATTFLKPQLSFYTEAKE